MYLIKKCETAIKKTILFSGLLREKHPKLQISVVYEDVPEADFLSLFRLLDGKYIYIYLTQLKVMRHESGICDISEGNYHFIFFL